MLIEVTGFAGRRSAALDWLMGEARDERFVERLLAGFCTRLVEDGVPLDRLTLHLRTLHPQFMGARMLWRAGMDEAELLLVEHSALYDPRFLNSPIKALYEGSDGFRQRLDLPSDGGDRFEIYTDLRSQGFTDYAVMPMDFVDRKRHALSLATLRRGGFATRDLSLVSELLPLLAMAIEIRSKNRMARNLLSTYVGRHAASQILDGAITRGAGMTVRAAIWTCDLRGFTTLSELWPRDDVIALLNDYFDAMADPVESNGGEVLKFIGDAMLAIFPMHGEAQDVEACGNALKAALGARRAMRALNKSRRERGLEALGFGLALHAGDVMYGNIGSKDRLDFTVIGPAVNVTSRLEGLSKELRREVLISGTFVQSCPCGALGLESLGAYPLRGVGEPLEVYAMEELP